MEALFGGTLQGKKGKVQTAKALADKESIGIYFSARGLPPCEAFTPKLAEWYTNNLQGKGLEIVLVSSDKDQASFDQHYDQQPWLALPFSVRDKKVALAKKFKVSSFPCLVLVDAEGKLIVKDGKSAVSEDTIGGHFPWTPRSIADILAEATFKNGSEMVEAQDAFTNKVAVGLFFGAEWCPVSRKFSQELSEGYKVHLHEKGLEVLFVSSDKDPKAFQKNYDEQPWLAVGFEDHRTKELFRACNVSSLPAFVIIDPSDFSIINLEGRSAVAVDPEGDDLPWRRKPVRDLRGGPGPVNESTTLVVLCEDSTGEQKKAIEVALSPLAQRHIDEAKGKGETDPEIEFLLAGSHGHFASHIRGLAGVQAPVAMLILDIPSNGAYYISPAADITAYAVEQFTSDFKAGKLQRKNFS